MTGVAEINIERMKLLHQILSQLRSGEQPDALELVRRGAALWPCSHRMLLFPVSDHIVCSDASIARRVTTNQQYADLHYTGDVYWKHNEIATGEIAVVAGIVISAADLLTSAEALAEIYFLVSRLWPQIKLPTKNSDWRYDEIEDRHFLHDEMNPISPHELLENLVFRKTHQDDFTDDAMAEKEGVWEDFKKRISPRERESV